LKNIENIVAGTKLLLLKILLLEQIVVPGTIPAKVDFKKKASPLLTRQRGLHVVLIYN